MTIPAALPAQQQRTQTIFTYVMAAIAAISLLAGGIGIMNIVLATAPPRPRDRDSAVDRLGARRIDIVRQFLTESALISVVRILSGVADRDDGGVEDDCDHGAGGLAFGVSVVVRVVFGIRRQACRP